jgi:hypothetical protein
MLSIIFIITEPCLYERADLNVRTYYATQIMPVRALIHVSTDTVGI